ncbi:Ephrin type-B receptor 4 [Mizuhopecten yessoensis]|uniref:Ephrin type-B receptor 4 n=1 Tax=Mizuhopecten yessoensis TaxID=6573 RepID=A0A210Q8N6_MIZYE|nr:Ephrin type-B receptor 4 [Mizuhopecten yessoensis]
MATNYPEHSSPEDTHKQEEVGIIGCSCQANNIEIIQVVCNENKINTKITQLSSEKPYILDKLSGCVCSIILLCSHYLELLSTSITGSKQQTSLILVGDGMDLPRLSSHGIVSVRCDEPDFKQILFEMIYTKINYDDCFGTTNATGCQSRDETDQKESPDAEYEVSDLQISRKSKQVYQEATVNGDENTNYTKSDDSEDENPYQTLSLEPRANLINLRTGESGKDALSGANVVEEYFHPSRSYWKELSEIISDINKGNKATVSELTKYVYTHVIPSAKEHKDLSTLSKLSECEGHGIEDKIAKEIQDLLFTSEVTRHQMDVLIQSLEVHLTVVKRKAISCKTTRTILPNVILMLAFVYHIVLDQENKDEKMDGRISILDAILDRTVYAPNQDIERHLQNATRMMLKGLKKTTSSKRTSCPQLLGPWREELMSDNTIFNMTCAIAKMTLPELYSLIAILFVQMHLGMELCKRLIDFFHTVVKQSAKKSANNSQLYPLLVIVCRGIASLLNRHVHQDQQTAAMQNQTNNSLCEILKTCVEKIKNKTNRDCSKALQEELAILLFHRSSNVARNVDRLMSVLGGVCIADKIPAYLQTILGPLGLTLSSETNESCPKTLPRWQELKGYIAGHREASVNVLLPDNNTFDLQTYVKSAKLDPTNGRHYNTMDMLKCLLGNDQHPHIRRLMAFQVQPMPVFYITELLPDATLSTFLLATRKEFDWQPLKMLGSIALTCVDVVRFLHERSIVHRNLIADSFKRRDKDTFVLTDLSIASYVDDDSVGSGTFVQDYDGKFIPTRWSAPESLLNDRYDAMSDTWMLGLLMHEIFTHGVHPFRDMYATTLDDIMENVVFNNLRPRWYPCIPCPIFEIIGGCVKTNPDERLELPEVLKKIRDWLGLLHTENEKVPKLQHATFNKKNLEYPELDEHQGEPERGPTEQLKNQKKTMKGSKASYYNNLELRKLLMYENKIRIKEEHLKAVDHPTIDKKEGGLEVREPVSKAFMNDTFPKMTSKPEFIAALTIADNPVNLPRNSTNPDGLIRTLVYRCQNAESLYEIAQIYKFGDPRDEENQLSYLKVVESLVQFVNWMHERSWILRDICCSTAYRAVEDGRVFMPRLGRMIKDKKRVSRIEACIIDKNTCIDDRRNWMPAEVINGGQFSQASDVYMLAMTVYEFYSTADLGRNNPMHNRLASVPFAEVDPKLLLDTLNRGIQPAKPMSCPQWLYELMQQCWDRDSTQRLTAAAFLSEISEKLATKGGSTRNNRMAPNTNDYYESGNSDSSDTLRKEVYPSSNQPTLPSRQNSCSCGNSSCGAEVTCSCRNSSSETGSIVSCGNSSCETCSVVSCGNSSCETCSVVSCGNSSCGTKNEFELNTRL